MHVRIKIYWEFYHGIIYIAIEGRRVRMYVLVFVSYPIIHHLYSFIIL
jgi:hypothetical protein